MSLRTALKALFGTGWHVQGDNIIDSMTLAVDGTVEAGKQVITDASKQVDGLILGAGATGTVGFYGATPVARRASAAQGAITTTSPVSVGVGAFAFSSAQAAAIIAWINEAGTMFTNRGDWKGSA